MMTDNESQQTLGKLFHIFHMFRLSMVSTGGKLFVNPGPEYRNSFLVAFYRFFSLHKRKKANGRNTDE
jgi:hypothetical protein